jgi:methylated-DNA-protein-cysteine methyltransferase-like protein
MQEPTLTPQQQKDFYLLVWELARQVPPGKVATYGQIASYIPAPEGIDPQAYAAFRARWAGSAMKDSPSDVPWQRVINSQGKISLPKGSKGSLSQHQLLESEGIIFDAHDRIDLDRFAWTGPTRDWFDSHGLPAPEKDYHQGQLPI